VLWAELMQTEPGVLGNLGFGALAIWALVMIVKEMLAFFGKAPAQPVHPIAPLKIEFTTDPTVSYRLDRLDAEMKERITRQEYERLERQLNRMESKLDNLWALRFVPGDKKD
jgi:hypothetical protein